MTGLAGGLVELKPRITVIAVGGGAVAQLTVRLLKTSKASSSLGEYSCAGLRYIEGDPPH